MIITIVILIILAGVSITLILGNNGIIAKSQFAVQKQDEVIANEQVWLAEMNSKAESYITGTREQITVDKEQYETLLADVNALKSKVNELTNWEEIYRGIYNQVSNIDVTNYKKIRITFTENDSQYVGWQEFDISQLKNNEFQAIAFANTTAYIRVVLILEDNKISYSRVNNPNNWSLTTILIQAAR